MNPAPPAHDTARRDLLLLLDGHSLAYRAFFALPAENFSTATGQPTNAVYGFTAMLINVLRDEQPTHVAVAFDRGEPTFRHEQWVEYKANRRETPADFRNQLSLIFEVLDALGIQRLSVPGYEADDIIATLATQAEQAGFDVLIVTGDRDVLQLVDRVDEVKGRAGDNLREHLSDVLRNRQLTELARDVPLEAGPADLRPAAWDREQIHQLFDTLQFRVLRDRLYSTLPNGIGGVTAPADPGAEAGGAFDAEITLPGPAA